MKILVLYVHTGSPAGSRSDPVQINATNYRAGCSAGGIRCVVQGFAAQGDAIGAGRGHYAVGVRIRL